jgi:hypothetical protein
MGAAGRLISKGKVFGGPFHKLSGFVSYAHLTTVIDTLPAMNNK